MMKYPTPAAAEKRPRHFALVVVARIIFWLGLFVAFSCFVTVVLIQEFFNGGANSSISAESTFLAGVLAMVALPLIISGIAPILFVVSAIAAGVLAGVDKTARPLRVFYLTLLPVFIFAAAFLFRFDRI